MTSLIFFFTIAILVRAVGSLLRAAFPPLWVKRIGLFVAVLASWFAATAFGVWATIWPVVILGSLAALFAGRFLSDPEKDDRLFFSPLILLDVVAIVALGRFAIPPNSWIDIALFATVWTVSGLVVDSLADFVIRLTPKRLQTTGFIGIGIGLLAFVVVNPNDLAVGSYRTLEARISSTGLANPLVQFQPTAEAVARATTSPIEVVEHVEIELAVAPEATAADEGTYLPLIKNDPTLEPSPTNTPAPASTDVPATPQPTNTPAPTPNLPSEQVPPESGEVVHLPIDIEFANASYAGNPFDLVAKVTFTHDSSGEERVTEMFYAGDDTWVARFTATQTGRWTYDTESDDGDLNNKTGELDIDRQPGLAGFVSYEGVTWVKTGNPSTAFIPQFMMYKDPDRYYNNPAVIDADIQEYMVDHGFNGLHVNVYCRWFDLEKPRCGDINSNSPNPDLRTFEALELLITKVHAQGGVVHLWAWGDSSRTQNPARWGYNGAEDVRLQRYIAARLGPIPGWTMGYGFDLFEWTSEEQLDTWYANMHAHMGWQHMLGARSFKNQIEQISEIMDYSGYEQHQPDYETYVDSIEDRNYKPSFSEDRFRIDGKAPNKDYSPEMTRRGLWHSFISGGIANIWGNLNLGSGGSYEIGSIPYPNKTEIKRYFVYSEQWYSKGLTRCNDLTDGYCLKTSNNSRYIVYKEDAQSISLNLSGMAGQQPFVALNTITGQEVTGQFDPQNQTWNAPSQSDWVIAIGVFD